MNLLGEKKKSETEAQALALLQLVEEALRDKAFSLSSSWEPSFVQSVVSTLETHPVRLLVGRLVWDFANCL